MLAQFDTRRKSLRADAAQHLFLVSLVDVFNVLLEATGIAQLFPTLRTHDGLLGSSLVLGVKVLP